MTPASSPTDVDEPWVAAAYSMAAGVLYMLAGSQVLIEALYLDATVAALVCVVLITLGLIVVLLGLDLLVNPFRHRALGIAICIVSGLSFVAMIVSFSLAAPGEYLLGVLPIGGIVAGASAILYESPGMK